MKKGVDGPSKSGHDDLVWRSGERRPTHGPRLFPASAGTGAGVTYLLVWNALPCPKIR